MDASFSRTDTRMWNTSQNYKMYNTNTIKQSYGTFKLNTNVHLRNNIAKCFGYRAQPSSSRLEKLCGLRSQNLTDVIYKYIL